MFPLIWPSHEDHERVVMALIAEAQRVGKVPWCADGMAEADAYQRLNGYSWVLSYPQETYRETIIRRDTEMGVPSEITSAKLATFLKVRS